MTHKSNVCSTRTWFVSLGSPLLQASPLPKSTRERFLGKIPNEHLAAALLSESQSSWAHMKRSSYSRSAARGQAVMEWLASRGAVLQLCFATQEPPSEWPQLGPAQGWWLKQAEVWLWALASFHEDFPSAYLEGRELDGAPLLLSDSLFLSLQIMLPFLLPSATPKSSQGPPEVLGGSLPAAPCLLGEALREGR